MARKAHTAHKVSIRPIADAFSNSESCYRHGAKLYDENLELARCLREKGLNVPDPSQQEPKLDLSGLQKSKDEITPLLQECGFGKK